MTERIYQNAGNIPLLDLLDIASGDVLDVGCGAGDNAAELHRRNKDVRVYGITHSPGEAEIAAPRMKECWVADIESGLPREAKQRKYDALIFSHVLEHLRHPEDVVAQCTELLRNGGTCVIAVPNIVSWAQRLNFLFGRFEYDYAGVMDETHLRFYTFNTAAKHLLSKTPELVIDSVSVSGAVPLWIARRYLLPNNASRALDQIGCRLFPNLFGYQVLIRATKS